MLLSQVLTFHGLGSVKNRIGGLMGFGPGLAVLPSNLRWIMGSARLR